MTPDWQDRIEAKIDRLNDKFDDHNSRVVKLETSLTWLKWLFTSMTSVASLAALAYAKFIGG